MEWKLIGILNLFKAVTLGGCSSFCRQRKDIYGCGSWLFFMCLCVELTWKRSAVMPWSPDAHPHHQWRILVIVFYICWRSPLKDSGPVSLIITSQLRGEKLIIWWAGSKLIMSSMISLISAWFLHGMLSTIISSLNLASSACIWHWDN